MNKRRIFLSDYDYVVFLCLLKRYLDVFPTKDIKGREYEHLRGRLELLAYCLMPNHVHMMVYLNDAQALTRLLSGVMTAYSMYFNRRYKRVGPLFQSRFKASLISNDAYYLHISRYIHLNPKDYETYDYSSLRDYIGQRKTSWLQPQRLIGSFEGGSYIDFVKDYEGNKAALELIKGELANF